MSVFRDSYGIRFGWIITFILTGMLVATGLIVVGATHLERYACKRTAAFMGTHSLYTVFEGCFVQDDDGRWVPLELYRVERGAK